jgi:putative DNA primase/helicase
LRYFSTVAVPYEYVPGAECPLWHQTLAEIFPRHSEGDRRIEVLQEFLGLTLISGDTTFEKFLILTGSGANGKSTILRIWRAVLGADNVSHVPLEGLSGEFRLADMVGKLANIAMDMQRMDRLEEGRLKEITSGEPIQINRKHKAPITTAITARLIFACNDLPQINDRSSGVWRRMIAMPFFASFRGEQADRLRGARLRQELAGIFNWSLAGAVRLYQQGAFTGCAVCDPTRSRAPAGVGSGGTVLRRMRRVPSRVGDSDWGLYAAYQDFCDGNGRSPKNSADFGKQVLMRPGVERRRRGDRQRQYEHIGVGLREGLSQPGGQRRIQPRSRPARAWR